MKYKTFTSLLYYIILLFKISHRERSPFQRVFPVCGGHIQKKHMLKSQRPFIPAMLDTLRVIT